MTALRRVDWRLVGLWSVPAAGVVYGLGYAGMRVVVSRAQPGDWLVGIDAFFAASLGVALGLAVAGAVAAALSRRGTQLQTATLVSLVAYGGAIGTAAAQGYVDSFANGRLAAVVLGCPGVLIGLLGGLVGLAVASLR